MSALPPTADIRQRIEHVRFVPITDIVDYLRASRGRGDSISLPGPRARAALRWDSAAGGGGTKASAGDCKKVEAICALNGERIESSMLGPTERQAGEIL